MQMSPELTKAAAGHAALSFRGLDIELDTLAQMAVTEIRTALEADEPALRRMAATLLADLPRPYAIPLLLKALTDRQAEVRIAAAISAGRMNTESAAAPLVTALQSEVDPTVSAQQIQALGELGPLAGTIAHETLTQLAARPGRIAVLATGALIATGDLSGVRTLASEMIAPQPERRLVAIQAAAIAARQPVMRSVLRRALADRMLQIRLTAAEALAEIGDTSAHLVLLAAAKSGNRDIAWRAEAALARLGNFARDPQGAAEMLRKIIVDTHNPKRRVAVVPLLRAYGPHAGAPVLRMLLADADRNVRLAAIDAIEDVAADNDAEAIWLYRPLVTDDDGFVRAKAAGRLVRWSTAPGAAGSTVVSASHDGTLEVHRSEDVAPAPRSGLDPQFLARSADLDYVRATLERNPAARRTQLLRVQDAYRQIAASGVEDLVRHATARLAEIDAALADH
ncbi:MAG: HEAT repeat domain-containing protein [Myxococcales bacterium]|nr:HEAT repeat domain-containing protein [Myxococcales bacterium]